MSYTFDPNRNYLTLAGKKKLEKELQILKQMKEQRLTQKELRAQVGEIEAEYFSLLTDLHSLEEKIAELTEILRTAEIITLPPASERNKVWLGAVVELEVNGQKMTYQLVDTWEADPMAGKLSVRSPVGSALLGQEKGKEVTVNSAIKLTYKIIDIKYPEEGA